MYLYDEFSPKGMCALMDPLTDIADNHRRRESGEDLGSSEMTRDEDLTLSEEEDDDDDILDQNLAQAESFNQNVEDAKQFARQVMNIALIILLVMFVFFLVVVSVYKHLVLAMLLFLGVTWMFAHTNSPSLLQGMGSYLFVWFYWVSYSFGNFLLSQRSDPTVETHEGPQTATLLIVLTLFVYVPLGLYFSLSAYNWKQELHFRVAMYTIFLLYIIPFEGNNMFFALGGSVARVQMASLVYVTVRYRLRQLNEPNVEARSALASTYPLFGAFGLAMFVALFHVCYLFSMCLRTRRIHDSHTMSGSGVSVLPPIVLNAIKERNQKPAEY